MPTTRSSSWPSELPYIKRASANASAYAPDWTLGCYHTSADCAFADISAGDMRITTDSKGIGGGVVDGVEDFARYADGGIDGCRMMFVNCRPICGAYQNPLRKFNVASALPGDSGITPSGVVLLAAGESAEIVVTPVSTRRYLGVEVDGDLIADVVRLTLSGGDYPPVAGEIQVAAKYQTDWYVDAAAADDSGNGFSPGTAKRTLAGAFGADVRTGDVVNCAAGEYAEGTMIQGSLAYPNDADPAPTLPSRVVVPSGVTLCGAGAGTTFIVGSKDTTETGDEHKRGPKAVRCVYLMDGAMLEGFTLRDGGTRGAVGGSEIQTDNSIGGGVICSVDASTVLTTVRDCVISNCVAGRGGAAFGGRYANCRIVGNIGVVNGIMRNAYAYNCYFNQNRSNEGILDYFYDAYNCTFGQGNFAILGGNVPGIANPMGAPTVANCLFLAGGSISVASANVVNCYHRTDFTIAAAKTSVNNVSCEPNALAVDDGGVPVIGSCLAIDNADSAYYPSDVCGNLDCAGNQRVWNGNMDVGAYEADWRPTYASVLGRRIAVTKADPGVKMEEGGVSVRNGTLELTYCPRSAAAKVIVSASMSGNGTLEIMKNGESVSTVASGSYSGVFGGSSEPMSFVFTHELGPNDDGAAFVSRFTSDDGFRMLIR